MALLVVRIAITFFILQRYVANGLLRLRLAMTIIGWLAMTIIGWLAMTIISWLVMTFFLSRKDIVTSLRGAFGDVAIHITYISIDKSFHSEFSFSINRIFLCLEPAFICFSLSIACFMSVYSS